MKVFKSILIFYWKLIIPSLILSGLIAFTGVVLVEEFSFNTFGISYMIIGLLAHYFIYEVKNSNEYYFYYNMGLSRLILWSITIIFNSIIGLTFILL